MIAANSPLRNLPLGLTRKQVLILDGLRHAAEITHLAYGRLKTTLTRLALEGQESARIAEAYLDAWAIVDAADRIRALLPLLPDDGSSQSKTGRTEFAESMASVRKVRNVADHLDQRIEYVIARKGSALGTLSWVTREGEASAVLCMVVPGSTHTTKQQLPNPAGKPIEMPTGFVHLTAGEHTVDLSNVMNLIARHVAQLERSIEQATVGQEGIGRHGADLMIKARVEF